MEFVKSTSGQVTDITIPDGNVIKIEEAATGRILWEKVSLTLNPSWASTKTSLANPHSLPSTPIRILARAFADKNGVLLFTANEDSSLSDTLERASSEVLINNEVIQGASAALMGSFQNMRFIAAAKDTQPNIKNNYKPGMLLVYMKNSNSYGLIKVSSTLAAALKSPLNITLNLNSSPERRVFISLAQDRNEFLITGLSNGLLILPTNFDSSTSINFDSSNKNIQRICRVPELGLYFANTSPLSKSIYYSEDGKSWTAKKVFSKGNILGIEYISEKKFLCAVNSADSTIALSNDGITWEVRNTPFSKALAFDYSPDYNLFCVVDNQCAYLTQNFSKWFSAKLPNNAAVEFTDLLYTHAGVFVAHQIGGHDIYFIFTDKILPIRNSYT